MERFYVEGFNFLFDNTSLCCPCVCISLPLIFAILISVVDVILFGVDCLSILC